MKRFSVLIVDDEPAARRILRTMLNKHTGLISSVAEAANGVEAVSLINQQKPDVVFLDVQMPGLTGFEVLQQVSHQPNVIFTTAYEEYALKAFDTFSVDYLLKPIRQERLDLAMEKLQQFGRMAEPLSESMQRLVQELSTKKPTAFPLKQGDRILLFRYETISHFEAADKYAHLFTTEGKKFLVDQTLSELVQKLPSQFLRVQKSYIINKEKIREVQKHFNGRFLFLMEDKGESRILSGLTFYETIKAELGLS